MSVIAFFSDGPSGVSYRNIMHGENEHAVRARVLCTELWDQFEPYADPDFLTQIRDRFDERFWEMYLTVALISQGHEVTCPKPGPDVGIVVNGRRIWFEAVSPSRGVDGSPDQVPEMRFDGSVQETPNRQMLLRYLNSISEKGRQYLNWLKIGAVSDSDAFVIALNPRRLQHDSVDTVPPRILQAAFPVGHAYIKISRDSLEPTSSGYEFRDVLPKASGRLVDTGVFLHKEYEGLSGLLVSRIDVVNRPDKLGADFQLLPNPVAGVPLPSDFRLPGTYFGVTKADDGYTVKPEKVP